MSLDDLTGAELARLPSVAMIGHGLAAEAKLDVAASTIARTRAEIERRREEAGRPQLALDFGPQGAP